LETPRLIMIDGLPGAGKSTAAEQVARRIRERGEHAESILETQIGHPLNAFPPDEIGVAWPEIHRYTTPDRFASLSLERWRTLVGSMNDTILVFESFPFQSAIRVLLQMDSPRTLIDQYWNSWQDLVQGSNACIVYFHEPDPLELIRITCQSRGEIWTDYFCRSVEKMRYVEVRGGKGMEAVESLIGAYSALLEQLVAVSRVPLVTFGARPASYDVRIKEVFRSLAI